MQGYWIKFKDGTSGYCEGETPYGAVQIAEGVSGKEADVDNKYDPKLKTLPYPATPIIWQFEHPLRGKCPPLCFAPAKCAGRTSCPQRYACSE